jgi:hypothetical protein
MPRNWFGFSQIAAVVNPRKFRFTVEQPEGGVTKYGREGLRVFREVVSSGIGELRRGKAVAETGLRRTVVHEYPLAL